MQNNILSHLDLDSLNDSIQQKETQIIKIITLLTQAEQMYLKQNHSFGFARIQLVKAHFFFDNSEQYPQDFYDLLVPLAKTVKLF